MLPNAAVHGADSCPGLILQAFVHLFVHLLICSIKVGECLRRARNCARLWDAELNETLPVPIRLGGCRRRQVMSANRPRATGRGVELRNILEPWGKRRLPGFLEEDVLS